MAIYRLPPSPFVGGRQPLDSRDLSPAIEEVAVNDPPPRKSPAILLAVLISWQPIPYPYQQARHVPQAPVVEEKVPFTSKFQYRQLEEVPYPQGRRLLNPSILAVPEDSPIPSSKVNLFTIIESWKAKAQLPEISKKLIIVEEKVPFSRRQLDWPVEYSPIQSRRFSPALFEVTEEKVPFSRSLIYPPIDNYQIQLPRKLNPDIIAVPEDNPPFNSRNNLSVIISSWKGEERLPQVNVKIPLVDEKIPFVRSDIRWQIDYIHPTQSRKLNPSLFEEVVFVPFKRIQLSNDFYNLEFNYIQFVRRQIIIEEQLFVPFRRFQLDNIFYDTGFSIPQVNRKLVQGEEVVFVPFNRALILNVAEVPFPQQGRKLNPSLLDVPVSDPPFGQRTWLSTVINSWEPPPPQHRKVTVNTPPTDIIIWIWKRVS